METLEDLITRVNAFRGDVPNYNKIVFAVSPAVELGIENLASNFDQIDTVENTHLEILHIIIQFLSSEEEEALTTRVEAILPLAEELIDAADKARSLSLVEDLHESYGEPMIPFLEERRDVIQDADDYLDKAELFVNSLIEISDQIN